MEVQRRNENALIYCLSSGPTLPEWLGERARRNLSKRDESIRRRIELLQDFSMPSSSNRIVQSSGDGQYIVVAGTYPPRIRCYDVFELGLKFERYVDAHIVDMKLLSPNSFGKMALLFDDRTINFHAPYGTHESIRIPTFGRAMAYEPTTCELLLASKQNKVYRFHLQEGRFMEPWTFTSKNDTSNDHFGANCIHSHSFYSLVSLGCTDGSVCFWDTRTESLKQSITLNVKDATRGHGYADTYNTSQFEITSLAHDDEGGNGMYMAAGTGGGIVALYDIRSSKPLHIMEHKHGNAIHTIRFHSTSGCILSGDEKLVKIFRYKPSSSNKTTWDEQQQQQDDNHSSVGHVVANVETSGKLSHFITAGDQVDATGQHSGLLLCATDQPKMESYFIPSLGVAPKWCSFLENITEELEERDLSNGGGTSDNALVRDGATVFDNYKFVSRQEVEQLGISNLVGTPLLRGYMHGFFMDVNLYNRVRAVANPFEYEEYRKKKIRQRIEEQRQSRIAPKQSGNSNSKRVNAEWAAQLQERADILVHNQDDDDNENKNKTKRKKNKKGQMAQQVLTDERFGNLFTNPDYQIDQDDENFKLRNPSGVSDTKATKRKRDDYDSDDDDSDGDVNYRDNDNERAVRVRDDHVEEEVGPIGFTRRVNRDDDDGESDDSDDDGFAGGKVRGEMYNKMKQLDKDKKRNKKKPGQKTKRAVMYEADSGMGTKDTIQLGLLGDSQSVNKRMKERSKKFNMSLQDRLKQAEQDQEAIGETKTTIIKGEGAVREFTYIPKDSRKEKKGTPNHERGSSSRRRRRGVKELGFKTPFKHH